MTRRDGGTRERQAAAFLVLLTLLVHSGDLAAQQPSHLTADSARFLLDGKPLQIISGEMHYARVPREYWRDRFKKARAMGLNTISTYVFWNFHESRPGHYDFAGQKDVAEYVREAGQEGLHVILRPGPYVCAEWEWGGYPAWLLADTAIVVRSTDTTFTAPAARWLDRLGQELKPLLSSNGGPIIAVQVENEYGSFDRDTAYMVWQRDALKHAGFGAVRLYTADGDVQLPRGSLPDLPAVVNFGPGEADSAFARLARFKPNGPLMSGEYWAGWFDQWGRQHHTTNAAQQTRELTWMLSHGYSVNLYMFHGGTTPGFFNGANIDNGHYHPQTSSYDYDSALDESGRPTPKYFAFRDAILAATRQAPLAAPRVDSTIAIPAFTLGQSASLWDNLGDGLHVERPRSMEQMGQSYGYTLYTAWLDEVINGMIAVPNVRDFAVVFQNGQLVGTLDRRLSQDSLVASGTSHNDKNRLDILVENGGRVNFAKPLRDERKGIRRGVWVSGREVLNWDIVALPMDTVPTPDWKSETPSGPAYYRGTFKLAKTGDTFLDTRGWGKGTVWLNGHQLGRFWSIGPQQTLYVPGPWLKTGTNEVVVFTLDRPTQQTMAGLRAPIPNELGSSGQ